MSKLDIQRMLINDKTLQSVTCFRIPPDAHYDSDLNSKQSRPQGRVGGFKNTMQERSSK